MPKINCLASAKKAYGDDLDNQEIESVYDALVRHKAALENVNGNLVDEMAKYADRIGEEAEFSAKVAQQQAILKGQVILDGLQREELFRKAGHKPKNSVFRSIMSKLVGSTFKVDRARDSTYVRQGKAIDAFYLEFSQDLKGELLPLFNSKTGQLELAQAMMDERAGTTVDSLYGKLARVFIKFQDRAYEKNKEVGIWINRLADRIAPNVHSEDKIQLLSRAEKRAAMELYPNAGDPHYEFAYQRWKDVMLDSIDQARSFAMRGLENMSPADIDSFMREAFDNIVNKGKASQDGTSYAKKFQQQRVFHWKDAAALVDYNKRFGTDSLQDSIVNELTNQFGMIEIARDWTVNPQDALNSLLEVLDENPEAVQRFGKGKEYNKARDALKSMMNRQYEKPNTISHITNGVLVYEVASKLGLAMPMSVTDLVNTSNVAAKLGRNRLATYAAVTKRMLVGMGNDEQKILSTLVQNGISVRMGGVTRFALNPYSPKSWVGWANHWAFKLNLLQRWEAANKGYIASVAAQHLAEYRRVSWDALDDKGREMFREYNIGAEDWEMIRQSSVKVRGAKGRYITPDSIQDVPDDVLADSLRRQGVDNPSQIRIAAYRDMLERKMGSWFRDRQEQAIVSPNPVDKANKLLTLGITPEDNIVFYNAIKIYRQFKSFGFAMINQTLLPILRARGATTTLEAVNPFSGKFNWQGMGMYGVQAVVLGWVGLTLKNAAYGLTPPSLEKADTWKKITKNAIGAMEQAFNVNLSDLKGSIGSFVEGAAGSDVEKTARLAANLYKEKQAGLGYDKSAKSSYQLVKNGIPYNAILTKWLVNHFWLNAMEDWAYPGKREQDLQQLEQNTGAKQLF